MTNTPTKYVHMSDDDQTALVLAENDGQPIQAFPVGEENAEWVPKPGRKFYNHIAYRIDPAASKVETITDERHVWRFEGGLIEAGYGHTASQHALGNITHTYTITNGRVTGCKTTIHD